LACFAAVALLIAIVARRRSAGVFGQRTDPRIRASVWRFGSQPGNLLRGVVTEGLVMAAIGIVAGAAFGLVVMRVAGSYFGRSKNARRMARNRFLRLCC